MNEWDKRFEIKKEQGGFVNESIKIIVDKETGVNYIWVQSGYAGGLTVLVDENGKPVVTK